MQSRFDTLHEVASALLDQGHNEAARIVLDMMHAERDESEYLGLEAPAREEGAKIAQFMRRIS